MAYPGGKGKCYQRIINLMPPHDTYIETHLGGAAVMRHKRPASQNIGVDVDPAVIERWLRQGPAGWDLVCADAAEFLSDFRFSGTGLVYADPPYLLETRKSRRKLYRNEYSAAQHEELLVALKALPCKVMISGYRSGLYDALLADWEVVEFGGVTQAGGAREILWMNFEPGELHDYRFVGTNFRERERIKRKQERWTNRLLSLPPAERRAIAAALRAIDEN